MTTESLPIGFELQGVSIVIAGEKKDLHQSQHELQTLVTEHHGLFTGNPKRATVMVTTAAELQRNRSFKLRGAVGKLTMLTPQWLLDLCARAKDPALLRTRAGAEEYLVPGTAWVRDIVQERRSTASWRRRRRSSHSRRAR